MWHTSSRSTLTRFIAWRYLISKKSHSVVNIISWISALSLAVPTAAMIILLSVHNGLTDFIGSLNRSFEPDLRVELSKGRFFDEGDISITTLSELEGVKAVSKVFERDVMIENSNRQLFIKARGADSMIRHVIPIDSIIVRGEYRNNGVLIGITPAYNIGAGNRIGKNIKMVWERENQAKSFIPTYVLHNLDINICGIYSLDTETENSYVIAPLDKIRGNNKQLTTLMIRCDNNYQECENNVNIWLEETYGDKYSVKSRKDDNQMEQAILEGEKYTIYILLMFVMIIASFTLISATILLIIEKSKDVITLYTLGMNEKDIKSIYSKQSIILSSIGILIGVTIGIAISLIQQHFGIIKIGGANTLLSSYPVILDWNDVFLVICSVTLISYIITKTTVYVMRKKTFK